VYDPSTLTSAGRLVFGLGAFRYIGGESRHKENLKLETPTASITIRGTELVIFVAPTGRTEIHVIEGAISVTACGGGGSRDLGAGERATIDPLCSLVDAARNLPPRSSADAPRLPGPDNDRPTPGPTVPIMRGKVISGRDPGRDQDGGTRKVAGRPRWRHGRSEAKGGGTSGG
jgi:hypothetical protein